MTKLSSLSHVQIQCTIALVH